jgi:hypothetical protein
LKAITESLNTAQLQPQAAVAAAHSSSAEPSQWPDAVVDAAGTPPTTAAAAAAATAVVAVTAAAAVPSSSTEVSVTDAVNTRSPPSGDAPQNADVTADVAALGGSPLASLGEVGSAEPTAPGLAPAVVVELPVTVVNTRLSRCAPHIVTASACALW